ncbi:MAG: anti-sigma factor antagonist [Planctomycetaceae bacterium]|nr:anti-sigma factor antagonist [Planctomycetaceae bacterium]
MRRTVLRPLQPGPQNRKNLPGANDPGGKTVYTRGVIPPHQRPLMFRHIESTRHGTVDVVRILERRLVDGAPLDDLREEIGQVVGAPRGIHLLLDLGNVEFLASAMLDTLCQFYRRIHAAGGQLRLCGMKPSITEVFRTTNLDRLFPIHADVDEAVANF